MRYEIPLTATPQRFTINLSGKAYRVRLWWNVIGQRWVIDLANTDGEVIISSIPVVSGADLLDQYRYLGLGGKLYAYTDAELGEPPTRINLGSNGKIYWETEDDN